MLRIKTPSCTVLQGGPLSARLPASRVPSKNFLATHQLDVHFCIEFLCTWYPQHCPSRVVCRKRAFFVHLREAQRITSSAWKRSVGGIVSPSASAVFRLMISSNFVGCSTGKSAGVAPFRILSTCVAPRRHPSGGL